MFFPPFLLETPFLESFTRLISDILPLCCYTRPSIIIPLIKWIRFFFRYVELSPTVIFEQCKFSSSIFCFFWRDYREEGLNYISLQRKMRNALDKVSSSEPRVLWKFSQRMQKEIAWRDLFPGNLTVFRNSSERKSWNDFFPYFFTFSIASQSSELLQPRMHTFIHIHIV